MGPVIGGAYHHRAGTERREREMAVRPRNGPEAQPLDGKRLLYVSQLGPEYPDAELEFRQL